MPIAESAIKFCVPVFEKKIFHLKKLLDKKEYGQYLYDLGLALQEMYQKIRKSQDTSTDFAYFIKKIIEAYNKKHNQASAEVTNKITYLFEYAQLCKSEKIELKEILKIDAVQRQAIRVGAYAVKLMTKVDAPPQLEVEKLKEASKEIIPPKENFDKYFRYFAKFIGICCAIISGALVFSGLMILILPYTSLVAACAVSLVVTFFSIKSNFSLFSEELANFFFIATRRDSFLFSGVSRDKNGQLCKVAFWKRFLLLPAAWLTSFAVGATSLAFAASGVYPLIKIFLVSAAISNPAVLPILTILALTLTTILCVGLTILMFVGFNNLLQKWENRENKDKKLRDVITDSMKDAWQNLKKITFLQVLGCIFQIALSLLIFHGLHFSIYSGMSVLNAVTHNSWLAPVLGALAYLGEIPFNLIGIQNISKFICIKGKIALEWLSNAKLSHLFEKILNPFQTCYIEIGRIYQNTEKNIFYRSGKFFGYLFKSIINAAMKILKLLSNVMKLSLVINAVGNGVTAATVQSSNIPGSHPYMGLTVFETGVVSLVNNLPHVTDRDPEKLNNVYEKISREYCEEFPFATPRTELISVEKKEKVLVANDLGRASCQAG